MSEQKMPALPINDDTGMYYRLCCWNRATVERVQREAYEAGRQHERERLEPLRAVLADLDQVDGMMYFAGLQYLVDTARTLLESDR